MPIPVATWVSKLDFSKIYQTCHIWYMIWAQVINDFLYTGLFSVAEPKSTLPRFFLGFVSNKNEIKKVLSNGMSKCAIFSSKSENRGSSNRKKGYMTRWGGLGVPLGDCRVFRRKHCTKNRCVLKRRVIASCRFQNFEKRLTTFGVTAWNVQKFSEIRK